MVVALLLVLCLMTGQAFADSPPHGAYLNVGGGIQEDGRLFVLPCYWTESPRAPLLVPGALGQFTLQVGYGKEAADETFQFDFEVARMISRDGDERELPGRDFTFSIPWNPGMEELHIIKDGEVLWQKKRSAHPPVVKITHPKPGDSPGDSQITLEWTGEDLDKDDLYYFVEYLNPSRNEWERLSSLTRLNQFSLDINRVRDASSRPSDPVILRVICTDGFNTAQDQVRLGP